MGRITVTTHSADGITGFSRENRLGLYGHAEWRVKALTLFAGPRYDRDTFINPTVSPRLALVYNLAPDHTIRLSRSVAYRPPPLEREELGPSSDDQSPLPPLGTTLVDLALLRGGDLIPPGSPFPRSPRLA